MIYEVTLTAPAINEVVVTTADSEEEAIRLAIDSAIRRMLATGTATVEAIRTEPP